MKIRQEKTGRVIIAHLSGEADLLAVPELRSVLSAHRAAGTRHLVLDFSEVTFVNTPIWALLIEHYQWAQKHGSTLSLCGLRGAALASFEIVQLGVFLAHYPTAEAAVVRLDGSA